MAAAALARG